MIVLPLPLLLPVIPPVIVPIVHAKLLGVVEVNEMLGPIPLHVLAVGAFVTVGEGFTVTVIVNDAPTHEPVVEVGVTK